MITTLNPAVGSRMLGGRRSVPRPDPRGLLAAMLAAAMTFSIAVVVETRFAAGSSDDASTAAAAAAAAATSQLVAADEVPTGLTAEEWESVRQQINEARSAQTSSVGTAEATVVASDPAVLPASVVAAAGSTRAGVRVPTIAAVGTVTRFLPGSAVVGSATSDASVALSTVAVGDRAVRAADALQLDDVVYYLRTPVVTEWYRETDGGLQQGFRIAEPVTDAPTTVIEVAVPAGTPVLVDPQSVRIDAPSGSSFWYRELVAWDADGVVLPAHLDVVDGRITLNVGTAGAAYPVTIDPTITEDDKLLPVPDAAGDLFGAVVAVDADAPGGAIAVVGAVRDDDQGVDFGTVYVFRRDLAGEWGQEATLSPSVQVASIDFGFSVAVSGDRIAVGAPGAPGGGRVHVFELSTGWSETDVIPSPGSGAGRFGESVAVAGSVLVVGAPESGEVGEAWAFLGTGTDWAVTPLIGSPVATAGGRFGASVDVVATPGGPDDYVAVVGSPRDDAVAGPVVGSGSMSIFEMIESVGPSVVVSGAPDLVGGLVTDGRLGTSVAVGVDADGTIVAVAGAPGSESATIATIDPDTLVLDVVTDSLGAGPSTSGFGTAVDFDGATIAIGSPTGSPEGIAERGEMYLFPWDALFDNVDGFAFATDFTDSPPLTFNQDLYFGALPFVDAMSGRLVLTTTYAQAASTYLDVGVPVTDASFSTRFTFQITDPVGFFDDPSGDGLTFVISDDPSAVGTIGTSLGYSALEGYDQPPYNATPIVPSVVVEFDTWGVGASGDELAVHVNADPSAIGSVLPGITLDDGAVWTAWIDYDAATNGLEVRVANDGVRPVAAALSAEVDLDVVIGATGYFGFTAATASAAARHEIIDWELQVDGPTSLTEPNDLQLTAAAEGDGFGAGVAVDGDIVVGGAPGRDVPFGARAGTDAGSASVWNLGDLSTPVADLAGQIANRDDAYGRAVAIAGNRMAVAAPGDDEGATDAGAVYMYQRASEGAPWRPDGVIVNPSPDPFDRFGDAVALLGDQVAIGESDRFGDQVEEGYVHVFERTGAATWTQRGASIGTELAFYDAFGASVAWQDADTLVVGAPAFLGTGGVFQVTWDGDSSSWNVPTALSSVVPPSSGDQLGFSVDVSREVSGDHVIVAGAPGDVVDAGALHIFRDAAPVGGATGLQVVQAGLGWGAGDRMGTAVAADRGYLAVAGIGGQVPGSDIQAYLLEPFGSNFLIDGTYTSTLTASVDVAANDYVELVGRNLLLSRPGGGGQVGVFRDVDGEGFPSAPVDQVIPAGREFGDAIGFSISVDGRTLVAGAPGDDENGTDAGSAYPATLALSHGYVGAGTALTDPSSWDTGLVPGPGDVAVVPSGFEEIVVGGALEVGRLVLGAGSTVRIDPGSTLSISGTELSGGSVIDGTVLNESSTTLNITSDVLIGPGGAIVTAVGGVTNLDATTSNISIDGDGTFDVQGTLNKIGPWQATIGFFIDYLTAPTAATNVDDGVFEIVPALTESSTVNIAPTATLTYAGVVDLDGSILIDAGATLESIDAFNALPGSEIEIAVAGPPASGDFGTITLPFQPLDLGSSTLRATVTGYTPVEGDVYAIATCYDCGDISGLTLDVAPFDVRLAGATTIDHRIELFVAENPSIALSVTPSSPTAPLSVSTIALTDLPPSAFQGYGGEAADYAVSSIQTLDLRSDVVVGGEPTPVADVTLGQLGLELTPLTADQLDEILLAELPVAGGWASLLEFTRFEGIPEQSLTLLDVIGVSAVRNVPIGDLGLGTTNLGNLSTYAVLLAGIPVNDLPLPLEAGQTSNLDAWCALAAEVGLGCVADFGADLADPAANTQITLPVLSFAGVDVDGSALLSAQVSGVDLVGSPIGDTALDDLNIGAVPLSAQPLVVSPALPSYVPPSVGVPSQLDTVTLGSLGDAVPLAALQPDEVLIDGAPATSVLLSDLELGASPQGSALFDFPWASPSIGAATLLGDETVPPAVADIEVVALGLNAPILGVPLDEIVLPSTGRSLASYRLSDLVAETSPFGISPLGISPFGISPFGISPFGISPFGISPFGISPFGISPFGISPFGISPFGISPFGISPFGISPFGISPFGISELSNLGLNAPIPAIPIGEMTVGGQPLGSYRISDLAPTNLFFDLPLQPFVVDPSGSTASPLDCSLIDCRQPNGFTIGDAVDAGALSGELTLLEVQPAMTGMYLGDLVGANPAFTQEALEAAIGAVDLTLAEAELRDDLSVLNVPIQLLPEFETAQIGDTRLFFVGYRLIDLVGLNADFTEAELEQAVAAWRAAESTAPTTLGDLRARLDGPLAPDELWVDFMNVAALSEADTNLTVGDVWPLLTPLRLEYLRAVSPSTSTVTLDAAGFGRTLADVQSDPDRSLEGLLWGDVLDDLAGVTVADLTGSFAGVTLGEFLRAAQPISDQKSELIDLSAIDIAAYGDGAGVEYSIDLRIDDATRPHGVRVVASLPADSRYVDLSAGLLEDGVPVGSAGDFEPTRFGDTLIWTIANVAPGEQITLTFEARAPVVIGSVPVGVTAQLTDVDVYATAGTSVEFTEALEPNDTVSEADAFGPISTDEIVLSQISDAGDVDVFAVDLTAGDRIGGVLWNLPADYDLTIIGPADQLISPAGGRVIDVTGDTDGGGGSAGSDAGQFAVPDGFAVIARSTNRALAAEVIDPIPVQQSGRYYLVVDGYNGANSDLAYAAQAIVIDSPVTAPVCVARDLDFTGTASGPLPGPLPAGTNTLLVTDLARMGAIHTPAEAALVGDALDQFVGDLGPNGPLSSLGIAAAVVDVGADPDVAAATHAWDDAPCEVGRANAVVKEIVNVLAGYYASEDIEYVVIVGSDLVIPMSRLADRTLLGNEQNYAGAFAAETDTALYAALAAGTYLSDDPYVDLAPNLGSGSGIYVPLRSIGRLVESPQQIIDQLATFVDAGGEIRTDSGSVLGYDFLLDSAFETADALSSSTSQTDVFDGPILTANLDTRLIGEGWTAEQMAEQFLPTGEAPGMVSLSGHFSHQGAQSALGSETDTADAVYTTDATLTTFGAGLLWSVGCHSGLSPSEEVANALGEDWAEVFTGQGALAYVAQTGFGYGETGGVLLSERLMVLFAQRLNGNYTVGEALMWAKNDYFAERGVMSVYDEKSLQQAVLYGLPFGTPNVPVPPPLPTAPPTTTTSTDPVTGLATATFSLDFQFDEVTGDRGTVWEIDGKSFATHDNPLQPITTLDVTADDADGDGAPDVRLHGSVLRSATGTLEAGVDPVYHTPTIDLGENEPEPTPQGVIYPPSPLSSSDYLTEFGPRDSLVVIPGKFEATDELGNGTQTLFDGAVVQAYYSNSTDWTPPTVEQVRTSVTALASGGQRSLVVSADVADESGIEAVVVVVVEDPTPGTGGPGPVAQWRSFDLDDAGSGTWSGATLISVCAEQVELSVYVVDGAGNVGVMSNKAANFTSGCDVEPPVQPPELTAVPDPSTLDPGGSGWHVTSPVTIDVTSGIRPLVYEVDGGAEQLLVGSSFTVTGDGVHIYVVRSLDGRVAASGVVAIDTTSPTAAIISPSATTYVVNALPPVVFTCADPSLVSCEGTLTRDGGSPAVVESGDPLPAVPGDYQLTVVATDEIEMTASTTVAFAIVSLPPSVVDVVGPEEPLQLGSTASISASLEYVDGFDGESVTVDFGDGTTCTATTTLPGSECALVSPTSTAPGSVSATHEYSSPGVYEVVVTVTDQFGLSTRVSYRFVVVYDPNGGFATGGGWIVPGGDSSNGDDELPGLNGVGTAHFAFVVKYKRGQQTPNGGLSFRYGDRGFRFESTELHWLVVNPGRAQFQGRGEIEGLPGLYSFKVEADDVDEQPNQEDRFTIKIWDVGADPDVDEPIYRASGDLGGGQIKVKTK